MHTYSLFRGSVGCGRGSVLALVLVVPKRTRTWPSLGPCLVTTESKFWHCKKKILRHIKLVVYVWSTKCWRNQKLIAQFRVVLYETNVLSLISQRLNNYYQIKTKCYSVATVSIFRRSELNAAWERHINLLFGLTTSEATDPGVQHDEVMCLGNQKSMFLAWARSIDSFPCHSSACTLPT